MSGTKSKPKEDLKRKHRVRDEEKEIDPSFSEEFTYGWNITAATLPSFAGDVEPIESSPFTVGETIVGAPLRWNMDFSAEDGVISLNMNLLEVNKEDKVGSARVQLRVVCLTDETIVAELNSPSMHMKPGQTYGWSDCVTVDQLYDRNTRKSPAYILQLRAHVQISGEVKQGLVKPTPSKVIRLDPDTVYLNEEVPADVLIHVNKTVFAVHKSEIKKGSPGIHLKAQDACGLKVSELTIDEYDEDTILALLSYVYSGQFPYCMTLGDVSELLKASREYDMPELSDACYDRITELVDPDDDTTMKVILDLVTVEGANEALHEVLKAYKMEYEVPTDLEDWANGEDLDVDGLEEEDDDYEEDEDEEAEEEDEEDLYLN